MIINFKQGVITYPINGSQQSFLEKSGTSVTLSTANGRVDVAFCHGTSNYLYTESSTVVGAWTGIPAGTDCWLYWDLDVRTGVRTFGFTTIQPQASVSFTSAAQIDQHWFDLSTNKMKVYKSGKFIEVIRVFAAKLRDSTFTPMGSGFPSKPFAGTQVGLVESSVAAGRILFDNAGRPIRRIDGRFFTTEDDVFINGSPVNTVRIESDVVMASALETIAKFQVVKLTDFGQLNLAAYSDTGQTVIAMAMEDMNVGETGTISLQGHIINPDWNWQHVGAALWITGAGELTETNPHVANALRNPTDQTPVARVVSPNSVYFCQGLGSKGDKGDPGDGNGGASALELDPVIIPNLMADDRVSPPDGTPATRGYHAYVGTDATHPIYPNGLTNLPSSETYKLQVRVDQFTPVIVTIHSGDITTFSDIAQAVVNAVNAVHPGCLSFEFVESEVPGVDDGGTLRFYSTTFGPFSYVQINESDDFYLTGRSLSAAMTLHTQTSGVIDIEHIGDNRVSVDFFWRYATTVPHQRGKAGITTLPYVDEYYIVAPQGTTTGAWSTFTNWDLLVYNTRGTWRRLGDARLLLQGKRVGIAMDSQSYADIKRVPTGSFAGKRGAIGTFDGTAWSFYTPEVGDIVCVMGTQDVNDPYNDRKRYRYGIHNATTQWVLVGDSSGLDVLDKRASHDSTNAIAPVVSRTQFGTTPIQYTVSPCSWDRAYPSRPPLSDDEVVNLKWAAQFELVRGNTTSLVATVTNDIIADIIPYGTWKSVKIETSDPRFFPQFVTMRVHPTKNIGLSVMLVSASVNGLEYFAYGTPQMYVSFTDKHPVGKYVINPFGAFGTASNKGYPVMLWGGDIRVWRLTNLTAGTPAWASIQLPGADTSIDSDVRSRTRYIPCYGLSNATGLVNSKSYDLAIQFAIGSGTYAKILRVGAAYPSDDVTTLGGLLTALNARISTISELSSDRILACWSFNTISFVGENAGASRFINVYDPASPLDQSLISSLNAQYQYIDPASGSMVSGVTTISVPGCGPGSADTTPTNYESGTNAMKGLSWVLPIVPFDNNV